MDRAPANQATEPKLLTQALSGEEPHEQVRQIAQAEHEYQRVHRQRPRFLVLHPDDYARLGPMIGEVRRANPTREAENEPVVDRVHAALDRGSIIYSDTDDPEWQPPVPTVRA